MTVTLTIGIAVLGDVIFDISLDDLAVTASTQYDIFVQGADNSHRKFAAQSLIREDVRVFFPSTIGAANSRNDAIAAANGDVLLFADDDLDMLAENYEQLLREFENAPELDFLTCRLLGNDRRPYKKYPPHGTKLTQLNSGKTGTPEIAIRVSRFRERNVQFDPLFGAGARNYLGDEYIFLCDALRAGLTGRTVEIDVAIHSDSSSGGHWDAESFRVRRCAIDRALGRYSLPARIAYAAKHHKRFPDFRSILNFLL